MKDIGAIDCSESSVHDMEKLLRDIGKAINTESDFSRAESTKSLSEESFLPSRVAMSGSFLLRTTLEKRKNIDIIAYMPLSWTKSELLDETNYLAVRARYIFFLSRHIESNLQNSDLNSVHVSVRSSFGEKTCVQIATSAPFSVHVHAGLRSSATSLFSENPLIKGHSLSSIPDQTHSALIRAEDTLMEFTLFSIHQEIRAAKIIAPVIVILKKWLLIHGKSNILPSHILSILVCIISVKCQNIYGKEHKQKITSCALLRRVLSVLASQGELEDMIRSIVIHHKKRKIEGLACLSEASGEVDAVHNFPYTFRITQGSIHGLSRFACSFEQEVHNAAVVDNIMQLHDILCAYPKLPIPSVRLDTVATSSLRNFFLAHDSVVVIRDVGSFSRKGLSKFITELLETAERALYERAYHINYHIIAKLCNRKNKDVPDLSHTVYFGIVHSDMAFSNLTKGPSNGADIDVSNFQWFWGIANTGFRRFADGSVHISRVWKSSELDSLIAEIIQDVWQRHHSVNPRFVVNPRAHLETSVLLDEKSFKKLNRAAKFTEKAAERPCSNVLHHAIGLLKDYIYSLHENGFPLKVEGVSCTHHGVRNTCAKFLQPHAFLLHDKEKNEYKISHEMMDRKYHLTPIPVVVELGKHSMWPNDIHAINQLLSSLGVHVCRILRKRYGIVCIPHADKVTLVILGYAFNLQLITQKIHQLICVSYKENLVKEFEKAHRFSHAHHEFVLEMIQKHPSSSVACQLLGRLVSIHLPVLSVPEETIELLVAKQVYSGRKVDTVGNSSVSLLMTTLQFILSHDWEKCTVVLDDAQRSTCCVISPECPMHFVTPYSNDSPFTRDAPSRETLMDLQSMAKRLLEHICDRMAKPSMTQLQILKPHFSVRSPSLIEHMWKYRETHRMEGHWHEHEVRTSVRQWRQGLLGDFPAREFSLHFNYQLITGRYSDVSQCSNSGNASFRLKNMNIYEKGVKDRAELLHHLLSFDPLRELVDIVLRGFSDKVKIYHDIHGPCATQHIVYGSFQSTLQVDEKKTLLEDIAALLGDALDSYQLTT